MNERARVDLSGRDERGNEKVAEAFAILQKEFDEGRIKTFIISADYSEEKSRELGVEDGGTRSSLAMCGNAPGIMTMVCNLLYQVGVQFGHDAPKVVISTYVNNLYRTDMTTPDGKVMAQKPGLDL